MADATYCSIDDLRGPDGALEQYTTDTGMPDGQNDTFLQSCLNDAQAILDGELGFTLAAAATGTQVVYGDGTVYLTPPPHMHGSVTSVTAPTGYTVPAYAQIDGALITTDTNGLMYPRYHDGYTRFYNAFFMTPGVWAAGEPFTVHATFGAAAADLLVCRRLTLELAVQLFRFRDAGGAVAVSTESAVVTVKNAFSPIMRAAIERLRQKYAPSVGVY